MAEPKTTHTYLLPSGAEIEIETLTEPKRGPGDVSKDQEKKKIPFEEVLTPLGEVTQLLFEKVKSSVREPDSVTLEFSASIKGQTKLLIVSGEGQGSIKVSLTWKKER
ncbi:MAG: hypothetical protein HC877_13960 [Thioploca sp.]|nr:hypothetical protein [Thioploca sp.]